MFDQIQPGELPCRLSFWALVRLVGSPGKYEASIEIKGPRGKMLQSLPMPSPLEIKRDSSTELVIQFVGVNIQKPGKYKLVVILDGKSIDELIIPVIGPSDG